MSESVALAWKRGIDLAAAAFGLLLLLPLLLAVGLLVKLTSVGPVFYIQERAGWNGRPLRMLKFRTMVDGADRCGGKVHRHDPRITPVGRWLRRFSIDELPQLYHVLTGEMSLIGPRPAPLSIARRFTPVQRRRLSMRPGLTGWAQVVARNNLPWTERIELDLWYIDHWSLALDLRILVRTVGVVLFGQGLYGPDGWNRGYGQGDQGGNATGSDAG